MKMKKRMLAAIRLLIITQIGLAFDKCGSFLCFFLPISAKSCIFAAEIENLPIVWNMEYISVIAFAQKYGISERTARNYCASGKIEGAFLTGKTWNIPADAELPKRKSSKARISPLLATLREQKEIRLKGSIYHRTQIDLTYNSNHIEGSKLTHDQTRYIFETNTIGVTDEAINVDDIVETVNHFRCIDYIIDHAEDKLSESLIKQLHLTLKTGTSDSKKDWFMVGDYKRLPNEVGGMDTCPPQEVHKRIKELLTAYNAIKRKTLDDILDFHVRFEAILLTVI